MTIPHPPELEAEARPDLIQVIYMSAAVRAFSPEELKRLLTEARAKNGRNGLTGMLLYAGGSFFQVLEGPTIAVDDVCKRISADPRHDSMVVLVRERIKERSFGSWSMGFFEATPEDLERVPGLNDFLQTPTRKGDASNADRARALLEAFRDGRWRRKVNA